MCHSRYFSFEVSDNFVDYLIDSIFESLQQWPEDYYLSDFNESWAESRIFGDNIWNEDWTSLTKDQQTELIDYCSSYVSEFD